MCLVFFLFTLEVPVVGLPQYARWQAPTGWRAHGCRTDGKRVCFYEYEACVEYIGCCWPAASSHRVRAELHMPPAE